MFFWFIATAVLAVNWVFKDPRFDYRLLVVGSVLPLVDGLFGGARALHSLTVSVALLAVLMLVTAGRKPIRRTLLGLPIGMLMHLVFGSAWSDTDTFWWPFTGWEFSEQRAPDRRSALVVGAVRGGRDRSVGVAVASLPAR